MYYYSNKVLGTPLSCAAARGHSDVVKYLLSKDVSIDGGYEHCLLQVAHNMVFAYVPSLYIYTEHTLNVGLQKWTCGRSKSSAK